MQKHRYFIPFLWVLFIVTHQPASGQERFYNVVSSNVRFRSDAALEIITAESDKLKGIIDIDNKGFAFSVLNTSFYGFNSALQREHFNENYMESEKFPVITFRGKIIEAIDFTRAGIYNIRTKGILTLHGVSKEKILKATLTISHDELTVVSQFSILLEDFNIKIPKVVHEKIAEEVILEIKAKLARMTE